MVKLRRVSLIESYILESKDLTLEAKKDLEDLKAYLGDKLFDDYMKIRDKISDPNFKDFNKLKKMDKKDIQDFVNNFKSKSDKKKQDKSEGAKKLYEDDVWIVYKITTYPAAQLYGKNTKWCITGRYDGHEDEGEEYFNNYIEENDLDGGYYFYINKLDPSDKYCVLQTKNKTIHSVWDAQDNPLLGGDAYNSKEVFNLPKVRGVRLKTKYDRDACLLNGLFEAIKDNDINKAEKYISKNIDLNKRPNNGAKAVINIAISKGNKDIVELLLKNGADPDDKNNSKNYYAYETPLFRSLVDHREDLVGLLLKYGADPNLKVTYGRVPLMVAVNTRDPNLVELLLKYGADPKVGVDQALQRPTAEIQELLDKYSSKNKE